MRRIPRISRPIGSLRTNTPSLYVCSACRYQASSFSTSSLRATQNGKPDYVEKLRRKIWGTDKPPGQENPYGSESIVEKHVKSKNRQVTEEAETKYQSAAAVLPSDYEPATTWDGLEEVGQDGDWARDTKHYRGFLPVETITETEEMTAALHRALVEVFALKQAGRLLTDFSASTPGPDYTQDVDVVSSAKGPQLHFKEASSLDDVLQSLPPAVDETADKTAPIESEEDVAADRSDLDPLYDDHDTAPVDENAEKEEPTESEEDVAADRSEVDPLQQYESTQTHEELIASWDQSWLQISIEDPELKFAVLKRTLQLTGVRISDSALKSIKTPQSLLAHLVKPPKPAKLIDALQQTGELISMPNVSVYASRVTPIDREKAIGRWKIIEKELEERGLPVTGH